MEIECPLREIKQGVWHKTRPWIQPSIRRHYHKVQAWLRHLNATFCMQKQRHWFTIPTLLDSLLRIELVKTDTYVYLRPARFSSFCSQFCSLKQVFDLTRLVLFCCLFNVQTPLVPHCGIKMLCQTSNFGISMSLTYIFCMLLLLKIC